VVNNFEATEISSKIGTITFSDDDTVIIPELNLWYSKGEKPLIIEFTFKCEATKSTDKDKDKDKEMILEQYPKKLALGASKFYESLQKCNKVIDLDTSKTKTDYVYRKDINRHLDTEMAISSPNRLSRNSNIRPFVLPCGEYGRRLCMKFPMPCQFKEYISVA
jgi:hypothetical protein